MSERLIYGKPGSGKSCFCVSLMCNALADWVRFDLEKGEQYNRVLYTNIPLNMEELNKYLQGLFGNKEVDVSDHVQLIEDSFFKDKDGDYREWWEDFPEGAFIVIDEVHHYLPANLKSDKAGKELSKAFVNYVSTHRHRQQDIIFLTQHLNNITPEVKRMAEVVYEVLNIKNTTLGIWPFLIRMQDVDMVREAWGCPMQVAHIKRGVCESNTVVFDKNYEVFVLTTQLFNLYRSHTLSEEALDRPSLRLGKVGSVLWLFRQYFTKFAIWFVIVFTGLYGVKNFIEKLPILVSSALTPNFQTPMDQSTAQKQDTALTAVPVPVFPVLESHHHLVEELKPEPPKNDEILGFVRGGVITQRGIIRQEEHLTVDGQIDYVKNVDVFRGIVYLGSGKKVQK